MTRINLVNPRELSDQHLVAEYREIFMVGSSLERSMKSKNWVNTKGHVTFFYNKGMYLDKRYSLLVKEMKRRGMNPDPKRKFKKSQWPKYLYNDWKPKNKDLKIIRKRIEEKINLKPDWYRFS